MVRARRGLSIGGHGILATRGYRIQGIDGVSLIAHGESIQSLFDPSQTRLQIADGRGLMNDGRLGTEEGLLYSLQLRGVLGQSGGVCAHLSVDHIEVVTHDQEVGQRSVDAMGRHIQGVVGLIELGVGLALVARDIAQRCGQECENQTTNDPSLAMSRSLSPERTGDGVWLDVQLG
jgi:hypothetical protein